jgi:hypothetical protein
MKTLFTSLFVALFAVATFAQSHNECRGGYCSQPWSGAIPDDGNNTLGQTYNNTQCGLNFTATSHMITTRYQNPGTGLPTNYNMQMPNCVGVNGMNVDKAYFWWGVSYNAGSSTAPTLTITNPAGQTTNVVAVLAGTSGPKCWGEIGTRTFRADVTSAINGNGNYLVNITGNPVTEIDGGTMVIIYRDPVATYSGTMAINDGCWTFANGLPATQNIAGFTAACQNSMNGKGFAMTGDQQNNISPPNHTVTVGSVTTQFTNDFWNYDVVSADVTAGTSNINVTNTPNVSDCWSYNVVGYYFQTACVTCSGGGTLTASLTSQDALCGQNNGWAAVSVSGGSSPYSYSWSTTPVQNGATATGLGAGTYTCSIVDACGSAAAQIATIGSTPGDSVVVDQSGGNCNAGVLTSPFPGSPIILTATVYNGTAPYVYLWSDGETTASISVTTAGTYSVAVTDANGCTTPPSAGSSVAVSAVNVACGHNGDKIILCHVPPGNPGNPQTICVSASAIPSHLANHPGDCVGPCSLYYAPRYSEVLNQIDERGFFAEAYPNPSSKGFQLHMIIAPDVAVLVHIYDVTGRIVETYNNVTEQTILGSKLAEGMYSADVIQGDNHQMLNLVKTN